MISEKDEHLLSILRENSRISVADIARQLNLSRTAAQMRLNKLENNGVIAGYGLRLSNQYLNNRVQAFVMIKSPPIKRMDVERQLALFSELISLYSISGEFDLSALISAINVESLDDVIDKIGQIDGVKDTMSSIILSTKIQR